MIATLFLLLAVQDPWPILDRASASFDTVRTLQADFTQVIDNPMLGDPDTTRGRLYQQKPNSFAMRFTEPKNDRIVADGRYLWLYTPSSTPGQAIRSAIPATGNTGPNLIGQFVERPRERYEARYVRADSNAAGGAGGGARSTSSRSRRMIGKHPTRSRRCGSTGRMDWRGESRSWRLQGKPARSFCETSS